MLIGGTDSSSVTSRQLNELNSAQCICLVLPLGSDQPVPSESVCVCVCVHPYNTWLLGRIRGIKGAQGRKDVLAGRGQLL